MLNGEAVPAGEKLVSLFEPHADMILKGGRQVQYGHKLNLVTGKSWLILDVVVEIGNPADAERFLPMLDRHIARTGAPYRAANTIRGRTWQRDRLSMWEPQLESRRWVRCQSRAFVASAAVFSAHDPCCLARHLWCSSSSCRVACRRSARRQEVDCSADAGDGDCRRQPIEAPLQTNTTASASSIIDLIELLACARMRRWH